MSRKSPGSTTERILLDSVRSFFQSHSISPEKGILVAFSGGSDSLTLLHLLVTLFPRSPLYALYVNHRLRSEGEMSEELKRNLNVCEQLQVHLTVAELQEGEVAAAAQKRGGGIEEAARTLRYAILQEARERLGLAYIATAHTRTDLLETLLMRVFQGSRLHFGSSLAVCTEDGIIRPLLGIDRSTIEEYLSMKGLEGVHDSTNDDTSFLRNGVRHALVPSLSEVFPGWREGLLRVSDEYEELNRFVTSCSDEAVNTQVQVDERTGEVRVAITEEMRKSPPLLRRVLYEAFSRLPSDIPLRLSDGQMQQIMTRIQKESSGLVQTPDSHARYEQGVLIWKKGVQPLSCGYISLVYSQETPLSEGYTLLGERRPADTVSDRDKVWIPDSLCEKGILVRSSREGDSIRVKAGVKKLSSLFQEWRIPPEERWTIPVLCAEDEILAVFGRAYGGRDRVSERVLSATLAPDETTLYSVRKDKRT